MITEVRSCSWPLEVRACVFGKKKCEKHVGGRRVLNKRSLHAICSEQSCVFHGGSISLLHFSILCPRHVLHAEGAEIIAMAAVAPQADAAFGTLRFPLRLTSSLIFRASLTLFTSQKMPLYFHSHTDGFSLQLEGPGFDSRVFLQILQFFQIKSN